LKLQAAQAGRQEARHGGGASPQSEADATCAIARADNENGLCSEFDNDLAAFAEAALAPAIKDSINQVISNRIALGHQLVTLLAFPLAARAAFRLFKYSSHCLFVDAVVQLLLRSICADSIETSKARLILQTSRLCAGSTIKRPLTIFF
jgi:hypothetical protein